MNLKEKTDLCSRAFISWLSAEKKGIDMRVHDPEIIEKDFITMVLNKKLEACRVEIHLPDMLTLIIGICTEGNPGQSQIILKELLESIKKNKGPIPAGYVILADDFVTCFMTKFPITEDKVMEKKYYDLWEAQKYENQLGYRENKCDTVEYWREVME